MGRRPRPYLPGAIFHLTARTLARERFFGPDVRSGALADLARVVPASRCRILAVAIMSNHLHLVLQQGERPLAKLMQPLLRRLAYRVQRARAREGPVFWRHYSAVPCLNPWHARNAIVYTHLNPVRAGMCRDPASYPWTSHALYAGSRPEPGSSDTEHLNQVVDPSLGLALFANGPGASAEQLQGGYRAAVDLRLAESESEEERDPDKDDSQQPARSAGEIRWGATLSPLFHAPASTPGPGDASIRTLAAPDMSTIARNVLSVEAPDVALAFVRTPGRTRRQSQLRKLVIRRLHLAGYRNRQIAAFMNVSESTVSNAIRTPPKRPV